MGTQATISELERRARPALLVLALALPATASAFEPMLPAAERYGQIGVMAPTDLVNLPVFGVDLGSGWTLEGATALYWRASRPDSRAQFLGTQTEAVLGWEASRSLSFRAVYSVFRPGGASGEAGPADTVHFFMGQAVYRY